MSGKTIPRILCVDDEKSILRSIRRAFFDEEIIITGVTGGREALEYCKNNEVDCIISDYLMPEMTGLELLNTVKREYPHIIRIMLSGYVEMDVIVNSLFNFTALSFFSKPWDEDFFKKRVYELLHLKLSLSNKTLWSALNNGFPLPVHISYFFDSSLFPAAFDKSNSVEDYIKNDISLYMKLLHIGNSDFMKGKPTWLLEDLISVLGREYLEGIFRTDFFVASSVGSYFFYTMKIISIIYNDLYTILYSENPIPLPDYASVIQIDKLMLASTAPDYIGKRIAGLKNGEYSILVEKDISNLMLFTVKLWHLPDIIQNFYSSYNACNTEKGCVSELEKQVKALKLSSRLTDLVIFSNTKAPIPKWWSLEGAIFYRLAEKIKEIRMK